MEAGELIKLEEVVYKAIDLLRAPILQDTSQKSEQHEVKGASDGVVEESCLKKSQESKQYEMEGVSIWVEKNLQQKTKAIMEVLSQIKSEKSDSYEKLNNYKNRLVRLLSSLPTKIKNPTIKQVVKIFDECGCSKTVSSEEVRAVKIDPLYGNKNEIIGELSSKYIDIKDAEVHGYQGKKVTIRLPKIGEFEGFEGYNIEYFISNESFRGNQLQNLINTNPEIEDEMILFEEIVELMQKIKEYMEVRGVSIDKGNIFSTNINEWKNNSKLRRTDVGLFLRDKAGFGDDNYYLRVLEIFNKYYTLQCKYNQFFVDDNSLFAEKKIILNYRRSKSSL